LKRIVLASKSTDRSEILKRLGIPFDIFVSDIDEEKYKKSYSDVTELAKKLAKKKALFAKRKLMKDESNAIIIAADTLIEIDGNFIGKARNEEEAFKILKKLNGRTHKLITGIAITEIKNPKLITDSDTTTVEFLELSDEEIREYIKTNEWKGRAGAYSLRDKASLFITKINGSSSNVIGLPLHKIYEILRKEFKFNLLQTK